MVGSLIDAKAISTSLFLFIVKHATADYTPKIMAFPDGLMYSWRSLHDAPRLQVGVHIGVPVVSESFEFCTAAPWTSVMAEPSHTRHFSCAVTERETVIPNNRQTPSSTAGRYHLECHGCARTRASLSSHRLFQGNVFWSVQVRATYQCNAKAP